MFTLKLPAEEPSQRPLVSTGLRHHRQENPGGCTVGPLCQHPVLIQAPHL